MGGGVGGAGGGRGVGSGAGRGVGGGGGGSGGGGWEMSNQTELERLRDACRATRDAVWAAVDAAEDAAKIDAAEDAAKAAWDALQALGD